MVQSLSRSLLACAAIALANTARASPSLPIATALAGAQAALSACQAQGYAVGVMVMDSSLSPLAQLHDVNGAAILTDIARRKAYTVIKTGLSSHAFALTLPPAQRVMPPPGYHGPFPPPGPVRSDPLLDPSDGGLPITRDGHVVGAISVSGAPDGAADAACAQQGLIAMRRAPPPQSHVGTLAAFNDTSATLQVAGEPLAIALSPGWTVVTPRPVAAATVRPGDFIASANVDFGPDRGRATELRILEPGYRPEFGSHPMGAKGLSMTHGVVSVSTATPSGQALDITFPGGLRHLVVPPGLDATAYDIRPRTALRIGDTVNAVTRQGTDSTDRAARLIMLPGAK